MLRVRDVAEVTRGFGEKVVGVNLEFAGTLFGNERLRDRGRGFEKAGDKRIRAAEKEAKAAGREHGSGGGPTKAPGGDASGVRTVAPRNVAVKPTVERGT